MAWMQCRSCPTKFTVGLLRCPHCQTVSDLYAAPEEVVEAEQEANVPKISVEGGPSNALGQPVEDEVVPVADATPNEVSVSVEDQEPAEAETAETEMSDATSDATDEGSGADEAAAGDAPGEAVSTPKPARKTAAKKTAAKPGVAREG